MKLKLNETIKNLDGVVMKDPKTTDDDGKVVEGKPHTLQTVIINALMAVLESDKNATGDKKLALFSLALAVKEGKEEVTVEEATLIKERIGKMYSPLYVGRAYALIEE